MRTVPTHPPGSRGRPEAIAGKQPHERTAKRRGRDTPKDTPAFSVRSFFFRAAPRLPSHPVRPLLSCVFTGWPVHIRLMWIVEGCAVGRGGDKYGRGARQVLQQLRASTKAAQAGNGLAACQ